MKAVFVRHVTREGDVAAALYRLQTPLGDYGHVVVSTATGGRGEEERVETLIFGTDQTGNARLAPELGPKQPWGCASHEEALAQMGYKILPE